MIVFGGVAAAIIILFVWYAMWLQREAPSTVRVQGSSRPVFITTGDGFLTQLKVYGTAYERKTCNPYDFHRALWVIREDRKKGWDSRMVDLNPIQYGIIPRHYMQLAPPDGSPPPDLQPDQTYTAYFALFSNPHDLEKSFRLANGKIEEAAPRRVCFEPAHAGRMEVWKRVDCQSGAELQLPEMDKRSCDVRFTGAPQ